MMHSPSSWDDSAADYDRFEKKWHHYGKAAEGLVKVLEIQPDWRVLELACGTGACTLLLGKICAKGEIVALDRSERMIEIANENVHNAGIENASFICGDATELSRLLQGKFDAALCNSAFWHFPEPKQVLNDLHELLKPAGRFGLNFPAWFPSEEAREQFRQKAREILARYGVSEEKLGESRMSRTLLNQSAVVLGLLEESHFKVIKDQIYEFEAPEESMREWRSIPVFSRQSSGSYLQNDAIPEKVREEIRNEFTKLRNSQSRESKMSKWRAIVAEALPI